MTDTPDLSEARAREAAAAMREACAKVAYRVCAEARHVTLGDKVAVAIRALPDPQPQAVVDSGETREAVAQKLYSFTPHIFEPAMADVPSGTFVEATWDQLSDGVREGYLDRADEVLALATHSPAPMGGADSAPDEDWLAEVIDDSLDMDWTGRVGAKAIIAAWDSRHVD